MKCRNVYKFEENGSWNVKWFNNDNISRILFYHSVKIEQENSNKINVYLSENNHYSFIFEKDIKTYALSNDELIVIFEDNTVVREKINLTFFDTGINIDDLNDSNYKRINLVVDSKFDKTEILDLFDDYDSENDSVLEDENYSIVQIDKGNLNEVKDIAKFYFIYYQISDNEIKFKKTIGLDDFTGYTPGIIININDRNYLMFLYKIGYKKYSLVPHIFHNGKFYKVYQDENYNIFWEYYVNINYTKSKTNYARNQEGIKASLIQKLSIVKGELWHNIKFGLPLFEKVRNKSILDACIIDIVLSHKDVKNIFEFSSKVERNHYYSFKMKILTKFNETINLSSNLNL